MQRFALTMAVLLITCVALKAQSTSPDDGAAHNGVYTNKYFHFSFRYPPDWSVHGDATNRMLRDLALERNKRTGALPAEAAAVLLNKTYQLLTVFQYKLGTPGVEYNPSVLILAENLSHAPGISDGRAYWLSVAPVLAKVAVKVKRDEPLEATYAGRKFYRQDYAMEVNGVLVHQASFVNVARGFALAFGFISHNEQDLEEMTKAMETLRFNTPKPIPRKSQRKRRG